MSLKEDNKYNKFLNKIQKNKLKDKSINNIIDDIKNLKKAVKQINSEIVILENKINKDTI